MTHTTVPRQGLVTGVLVVALAGVLGTAIWTWQGTLFGPGRFEDRPLEGLKVFGVVPDFSLIERDGQRVTLADLRGKVWVANFIYTHCTETCPLRSAQIARLQEELRGEPEVRFVSITVDPEQDPPEVISEYAARFGADRERWLFFTGEKRAIYALAVEGFRLGVTDPDEMDQGPRENRASPGRPQARQENPSQQPGWRVGAVARILRMGGMSLSGSAPALAHPGHPGKPFLHSSWFVAVDRQARIRGYSPGTDEEVLGRLRQDVRMLLQGDQS